MQERVGSGVLVIALAVGGFPFSCFKFEVCRAAKTVSMSFEDIVVTKFSHPETPNLKEGCVISRKWKMGDGSRGQRFSFCLTVCVYWWNESTDHSYVIMKTVVWELLKPSQLCIWENQTLCGRRGAAACCLCERIVFFFLALFLSKPPICR